MQFNPYCGSQLPEGGHGYPDVRLMRYVHANCSALKFTDVQDQVNTKKVQPEAQLILYNSAFWGSPTVGAIINSGTVRLQQTNFQRSGAPGIDNRGGKVHVYTSYFAQPMEGLATGDNVHPELHRNGKAIELTNNYYRSGFRENNAKPGMIYGTDIVPDKN